jgi:lipopolysaccharide/colanic/teichoic acid biosynthesis glycosyltransferase
MYIDIKRLIDIVLATIAIIILLPLFLVIIILLKFTGEHEVFYLQERVGYFNKKFKIIKFATMVKDSPNLGNGDVTLRGDSRITPIGKYLRLTKINELPQLLNILKGDMSVVGPRPLMDVGFYRYSEYFQARVYNLKPGLTGIGAILFRDEEMMLSESSLPPHDAYEKEILPYKGAVEMWYQEHLSFSTDMLIILLTAVAIITPDNELTFRIFKDLPIKQKADF